MTITIYPEYKNAAHVISKGQEIFYSDKTLATMLMADKETKEYQFRLMHLVRHLLEDHGIDFIRAANEVEGKGYKIATDKESLDITVSRLSRKVRNTACKQAVVLNIIDREKLEHSDIQVHEQRLLKNGLLLSFLAQSERKKITSKYEVRIDVPKIIPITGDE